MALHRYIVPWLLLTFAIPATATKPAARNGEAVQRLITLSQEYTFERSFDAAQQALEEALRISPDHPRVLFSLANLLSFRQRDEEAAAMRQRARAGLHRLDEIERFYIATQMDKEASPLPRAELEAELARLARQHPRDPLIHMAAGQHFSNRGEFATAIGHYHRALEAAPWLAQAHNLIGYMFAYTGDYDRAIAHLSRYAEMLPGRANPHDSLGELYLMTGQYDLATDSFHRALQISPRFTAARENLVKAYTQTAQYRKARQQALTIWEHAESERARAWALGLLCEVDHRAGQLDRARRVIARALAEYPDSAPLLYQQGVLLLKTDQLADLPQTLQELRRLYDKSASSSRRMLGPLNFYHLLQARWNIALGNFETSIRTLQQIIGQLSNPDLRVGIQLELAEAYFATGQLPAAQQIVEQILRVNPNHPSALLLHARVHTLTGRQAQAVEAVDRALSALRRADPDTPLWLEAHRLRQIVGTTARD